MSAVDLTYARLRRSEGVRPFAYDDSTGRTVSCKPAGNLTVGVGINLEVGLDDEEIAWLCKRRLSRISDRLSSRDWYRALDEVRASVALEIAFNVGIDGFLVGFPNLISALRLQAWPDAQRECHAADVRLKRRYATLGTILLSGVDVT